MMRVRERRTERERESARARDDAVLLIILRIIPGGILDRRPQPGERTKWEAQGRAQGLAGGANPMLRTRWLACLTLCTSIAEGEEEEEDGISDSRLRLTCDIRPHADNIRWRRPHAESIRWLQLQCCDMCHVFSMWIVGGRYQRYYGIPLSGDNRRRWF